MVLSQVELERRIEQKANDTDAIYGILKNVNATLDTHTKQLDVHTTILGEHTTTLGEHSKILNEHGKQLEDIKGQLDIVVEILTAS